MDESNPVYNEAKYNFVDEDESSPSLFWKLNSYHLSKSEFENAKIPFNGATNQVKLSHSIKFSSITNIFIIIILMSFF